RVIMRLWYSLARVRLHLNVTTKAGTRCVSCCPMMCRTTPRYNKPWQPILPTARGSGSSRPVRGRSTPTILSPPCCRAYVVCEKRRGLPVSQYSSIPGAGHSDVGIQRETIWLWLIVIMGALIRLYRLDYQSLWLDEGWQYSIASAQSLRDVSARALEPSAAHPP